MILVDTSVWIDYFNDVDNFHTTTLDLGLIEGTVAIGDIIFLEILQGFRKDSDYKNTKARLSTLEQYEMFGHRMVNNCAENYRSLRKSRFDTPICNRLSAMAGIPKGFNFPLRLGRYLLSTNLAWYFPALTAVTRATPFAHRVFLSLPASCRSTLLTACLLRKRQHHRR